MLYNFASLLLIVLASGYIIGLLGKKGRRLIPFENRAVRHVLAVLTGAAFGVVAVQAFEYRLAWTLACVVVVGAAFGYAAGRGLHTADTLRMGLTSCFSSAIAVVLGMTLYSTTKIAFAVDIVFIILTFLLQRVIEWRVNAGQMTDPRTKKKKKAAQSKQPSLAYTIAYAAVVAIAFMLIVLKQDQIVIGQVGLKQMQHAQLDDINNLQLAQIEVNATGFSPRNTVFDSGTMIKVNFHVANVRTDLRLISEGLNLDIPLQAGDNKFLLNNPQPGTYDIQLSDGSSAGTFVVEKAE